MSYNFSGYKFDTTADDFTEIFIKHLIALGIEAKRIANLPTGIDYSVLRGDQNSFAAISTIDSATFVAGMGVIPGLIKSVCEELNTKGYGYATYEVVGDKAIYVYQHQDKTSVFLQEGSYDNTKDLDFESLTRKIKEMDTSQGRAITLEDVKASPIYSYLKAELGFNIEDEILVHLPYLENGEMTISNKHTNSLDYIKYNFPRKGLYLMGHHSPTYVFPDGL